MYLTKKKVKNDLKNNDLCIYISDRSGRKSSVIQDIMLEEWKKTGFKPLFALLRSKTDENVTRNWFSEFISKKYKDFEFYDKKINNYISVICAKINNKECVLCFTFFISVSQKYKSLYYNGFETLKYIIWEECIPENPIRQDIDFVNRSDEILNKLFSISSSVCREKKPKFIFLGNDIEYNFLNPINVKFNLLDKIELNKDISGRINIYNLDLKYNFYYFDFKNSVNHWENLTDISLIKNFDKIGDKSNFCFILDNKKYFIYENEFTVNIMDFENSEDFNEKKFLNRFFSDETISQYFYMNIVERQVFLELLRIKNSNFNSFFENYYSKKIEKNNIVYYFDDKTKKEKIINYDLDLIIKNYNYSEIIENCLPLYNYFKDKFLKKRLYSNFAIKTKFEKLIQILITSFLNYK